MHNKKDSSTIPFQKILVYPWLAVCLIFIIWFLYVLIFQNKCRVYYPVEIINNKNGFAEVRLQSINIKGEKTYVESNLMVKFRSVDDPINVYAIIKDQMHIEGRYKLEGEYSNDIKFYEGKRNFPIYPQKGSLANFPFDNLLIEFTMDLVPKKIISKMDFYQEVNGFCLTNAPASVYTKKDVVRIKLYLERKLYYKALFLLTVVLAILYVLLVALEAERKETLGACSITFFASLFALRKFMLSPPIKNVITLVDKIFLFLAVLLFVIVLTKFLSYITRKKNSTQ